MDSQQGKTSQVQDNLELLEKAIRVCGEIIEILESRLVGVLQPVNAVENIKEPRQELVPLAASLCDLTLLVAKNTTRLQDIIDRMEL